MSGIGFALDIFTESVTATELVRNYKGVKEMLKDNTNGYVQVIKNNKVEMILCTPEFFKEALTTLYEMYFQEIKKNLPNIDSTK